MNEKKFKRIAIILSIVLPIAVAFLFTKELDGYDFHYLPSIYATINGITAIVLLGAYIAIKKKNKRVHQNLIHTAIFLSVNFLVLYVIYHATSVSTVYGDLNHNEILEPSEALQLGAIKYFYYFILLSHILLSIIITPFVCFTYLRGYLGEYDKHKKLARITFPLWMYVAVSGVIVYIMISPYYI